MSYSELLQSTVERAAASPAATTASLALALLSVALVLCFVRLAIGPSLPDRVVALDLVAVLLAGALVLHSIAAAEPNSLRVALVLALINFLATVGFAAYMGRRTRSQ